MTMTNHTQHRRLGTCGKSSVQNAGQFHIQLGIGTHFEETLVKALHVADATEHMFYALGMDKLITGCEKLLNYQRDYVQNSVPVTLSLYVAYFIY